MPRRTRSKIASRRQIEERNSPRYLKIRDRFRAQCAKIGACCHLCGQYIDYDIPANQPDSFWLLDATLAALRAGSSPWIVENVMGADMGADISELGLPATPKPDH